MSIHVKHDAAQARNLKLRYHNATSFKFKKLCDVPQRGTKQQAAAAPSLCMKSRKSWLLESPRAVTAYARSVAVRAGGCITITPLSWGMRSACKDQKPGAGVSPGESSSDRCVWISPSNDLRWGTPQRVAEAALPSRSWLPWDRVLWPASEE